MVLIGFSLNLRSLAASVGEPKPGLATEAMKLLRANCLSCHSAEKQKGGLAMTARDAVLKGGDSGAAVTPGQPDASLLVKVLAADSDPHMPPKKQLAPHQIDLVRRWIAEGLPWDDAALKAAEPPRLVKLEAPPANYTPVLTLGLSPDEKRLAVGRANRIVLYDLAATNFTVLGEVEAHGDAVRSLAWSPDGRRLASGSFREITLWDAATLKLVWTMTNGLIERVTALKFSPYGGALVAADGMATQEGWVHILNAESGKLSAGWPVHTDSVLDLAISPDGGLLATAGADKLVKLWELVSQKEVARLEGHAGAVTGAAFNTNASEIVSVGADKQLKLWDAKTRESVVTVGGHKQGFNALAWSADGKTVVAAAGDGRLFRFSNFKRHTGEQSSATADESQLGHWPEPLHAVAVSADGQRVFAGGQDGAVYVVNHEGKQLARLEPGRKTSASALLSQNSKTPTALPGSQPSFVHDILPMLAKAGCSAGSCHAKPEGQNGFKLSVFSYDPKADYAEIVKAGRGRRVFPAAPEESLLLLKPTMTLDHGGGQRIEPGSETYRTIAAWIRGGMIYQRTNEPALVKISVEPRERRHRKGARQQLLVTASYDDGSDRDVTHLADYIANEKEIATVDEQGRIKIGSLSGEGVIVARFMGQVDAARVTVPADQTLPDERYASLPKSNFIDELAYAQFRKLGLFPSELCTDAEFLRRASLDTIGVLPTPEEARTFLADANASKRLQGIDRLLARPEFADYWANKWADLLRPNPDRVGVKSIFTLDQWLREAFRANKPYDQFVREIVTLEGSNHRDGPAVIYRDRREPPELTTMFSQLFLGVRMECAKCHHHPNEKWSQDDFYQFAAFFGPLKQKGAGLSPPISAGFETFYFAPGGSVKHPLTDEVMKPKPPDGPVCDSGEKADPRAALADWMTNPKNPFFAKAAVNRVWAVFFGRGFVEPVDDFRVSNPPTNEPLLNALAEDFAEHGYELKHLIRRITSSRLYQLSSTPNEFNLADTKNFSRSLRRRLPAEVLLDAVNDVTGLPDEFNGCPPGTRAVQTWSYKINSQFMDAFGRPNSSSDCPCERDLRTSVVQSLHMMNSKRLQEKLAHADGRVKKLAESQLAPEAIVAELYFATVSRPPTAGELRTATAAFNAKDATRQTAAEDVLWALLNSAEFVLNH